MLAAFHVVQHEHRARAGRQQRERTFQIHPFDDADDRARAAAGAAGSWSMVSVSIDSRARLLRR